MLLGIEKVRIVPGITTTNPLDLYYMPHTHSLIGAILWAIAAGIGYVIFRRTDGWRAAGFVGGAVFSHWALDWLVHRPDLPLYDNSFKVGRPEFYGSRDDQKSIGTIIAPWNSASISSIHPTSTVRLRNKN